VHNVRGQWENGERSGPSVGATHRGLRETVQEALRTAIIEGTYAQGERLIEEEIAVRFDVSRNPIREALHALAIDGFVVVEPRRGARVATIDARRCRELFELRAPLEGLVAKLAATRRSSQQLAELRAVVNEGVGAAEEGRLEDLPGLNTEFHRRLAAAADNELLANTLARLSGIIQWVYSARIKQRSTMSWREHAAIVEAVAAEDPVLAERCGFEHISAAAAVYAD
jgi:DNA-binding GntR family transcriptional regulator